MNEKGTVICVVYALFVMGICYTGWTNMLAFSSFHVLRGNASPARCASLNPKKTELLWDEVDIM